MPTDTRVVPHPKAPALSEAAITPISFHGVFHLREIARHAGEGHGSTVTCKVDDIACGPSLVRAVMV